MATLKNTVINDTGYLKLPNGTSAQRPATPVAGDMRFNTSLTGMEFYNGTNWVTIGVLDGSTSSQANTSAAAIKSLTGTTTNGFYWIYVGGVATQVWCDMSNDGGGWMLAAKMYSNNSRWNYDDSDAWTGSSTFNADQDAVSYAGHIKTSLYTSRPFSQVRLAGGSISNGLVESGWSNGTSFASFMGSSTNSGNSRTTWVNWMTTSLGQDPLAQGNCNIIGTNKEIPYQYVRIGGSFNNENDCTSNDSGFGFGQKGTYVYSNSYAFGAYSSSGRNQAAIGWIFIK